MPYVVKRWAYVDGVCKGEVWKHHVSGRWMWRRGVDAVAVEPFAKGSTLADVKEWIRKCHYTGKNNPVVTLSWRGPADRD